MKDLEKYQQAIISMIKSMEESDVSFLVEIYTIIKKYIKKRGR